MLQYGGERGWIAHMENDFTTTAATGGFAGFHEETRANPSANARKGFHISGPGGGAVAI